MKKQNILIMSIGILGSLIAFCGCARASTHKTISVEKAKEMIDNGGVVIVDVREQDEYNSGHIDGAILLPLGEIKKDAGSVLKDKDATILVYCRSGVRSAKGAKQLASMGYTNIYDIGGINSWKDKGYKVV